MAAVVTLGSSAIADGTLFSLDLASMGNVDAYQTSSSSSSEEKLTVTQGENSFVFEVTGTNVTTNGTITDLSYSVNGTEDFGISGLAISAADLQTALSATGQERAQDFLNLFKGTDWQADLSATTQSNLVFGTGGDDQFTFGSTDDYLMLDGGNDDSDLGGGNDFIYARNLYSSAGYSAAGESTINGGDGNDTFALDTRQELFSLFGQNFDFFSTGQKVDLTKAFIDGVMTVHLVNVENLRGSKFNDSLLGDANANNLEGEEGNDKLTGRDGNDTLVGDEGNDKLTGGAGVDMLTGGAGSDHFIYAAAGDSGKHHDVITDFTHKQDKLDISALKLPKHVEFAFIGDHQFGHHAGEVQAVQHDNTGTANDFTMVNVDLDGNGKADLQIELTGLVHLDKNDFIF